MSAISASYFHHRTHYRHCGLCASVAGLATQWIVVGALILLGLGIVTGVTRTRQKDPSHD